MRLILTATILIMTAGSQAIANGIHPSLLASPEAVELAKTRIQTEQWAKDILDGLVNQAEALEKETLPIFEKDWWEEAKTKPVRDIYPEINYHTRFAVAGTVARAREAAIAYALTGEPRYAELVRKVLLHYTDYDFFAVHPDVGLNWSGWCLNALQAYDFIYDTLTVSDRTEIDNFFDRAMKAVRENDELWIRTGIGHKFNNHYSWRKLFIGSYGLFYDRPELVDYAINSNQGLRELIENGALDDGIWFESSINYHMTALQPIAIFASQLSNAGHPFDLWNHSFANGRRLRDMFLGPIGVLFPDETLPTIGDTYGNRARLGGMGYYLAYDTYRLPEIGWLLRNSSPMPMESLFLETFPAGEYPVPSMTTRIWPEHGYIGLRTQEGQDYWRGEGYSVFLSFDRDSIHAHRDKFGLMVYGRGAHLAIDPEARSTAQHAFSSEIQRQLNRSTVAHNTVMVNGKDHNRTTKKLELVDFINGPEVKLATIADKQGLVYPGVKMMRTVAATDDYVLDVFQVASEEEHTYDYLFHTYDDEGTFATEEGFADIDLGSEPPWYWLRGAREKLKDGDWSISARQGELTTRLTVLGEAGTHVITCEFPRKDDFEKPSIPMLMARRQAKSTVFVTVLQAERQEIPAIRISARDDRHGLLRIIVICGDQTRDFTMRKLDQDL